MKSELEAFEELLCTPENIIGYKHSRVTLNQWTTSRIELIKQALTPPTTDEVCKELSDNYGLFSFNVYYLEDDKTFYHSHEIYASEEKLVWFNENGEIQTITPMNPTILKHIAQFYESLEEVALSDKQGEIKWTTSTECIQS